MKISELQTNWFLENPDRGETITDYNSKLILECILKIDKKKLFFEEFLSYRSFDKKINFFKRNGKIVDYGNQYFNLIYPDKKNAFFEFKNGKLIRLAHNLGTIENQYIFRVLSEEFIESSKYISYMKNFN